jgi:hypothetical protein
MASSASIPPVIEIGATPAPARPPSKKAEAGHIGSARYSGALLPPSPPAEKAAARQDQARQACTRNGAGERPASLLTEGQHASKLIGANTRFAILWITIANFWTTEAV